MAVPGALRSRLLPRGLQAGGLLAASLSSLSSPVLLSSAELEPGSWHHDGRFFWSDCERRSDSLIRVVRMLSERAGSRKLPPAARRRHDVMLRALGPRELWHASDHSLSGSTDRRPASR